MRKKLQLIAQTMLLLFLPAFVMRPVMVNVANAVHDMGASHAHKKVISQSYQVLTADHSSFRTVSRENSKTPVLTPSFTKTLLTLSQGPDLLFASNSISSSPQSFLVLRI